MLFSDEAIEAYLYSRPDSLNPCCNGCCSLTCSSMESVNLTRISLNPCCNGCCSLTGREAWACEVWESLNPCCNGCCSLTPRKLSPPSPSCGVLILVVMDAVLWHLIISTQRPSVKSLNPCCNGCCSLTSSNNVWLFLLLQCLNPCCNGCCSLTDNHFHNRLIELGVLILVVMDAVLWPYSFL